MEQEGVKCFVVMANHTDLAKFRGARVQAIREETPEQWMVAPVELVRSVLTEDWSDDYAASEHWSKYWNAVSAPSDDEWPEGLTEDGEAGSDPRGHLGVTWGGYLCADKPPLADIILSHPPDLTRCDGVIGLAIPAMSGHIRYRGAASGDLYIRISGINRVFLS